jgi:hypothetical protein
MHRVLTAVSLALSLIVSLCLFTSAATAQVLALQGPTVWGRSGWEAVPLPVAESNDLLLSCISATDCVASDDSDTNGATFLRTADGGVTWHPDGSYGFGIGSLSCLGTAFCMAVPYGGDPHLVVANQAGPAWSSISQPAFVPSDLQATTVACVRSFCMVTGGDSNGNVPPHSTAAFVTGDRGETWEPIRLPPPIKDVQALACTPNGTCYLVYDTYTHQFSDIAVSTNRGRSWVSIDHAQGFTSAGGFSCPSQTSCVYLATQVLEQSSGAAPTWTDEYGPFTPHKQNPSVSAFALSCVTVSQCMIGGGIGDTNPQQVVWIQAPQWNKKRMARTLRAAALTATTSVSSAASRLSHSSGSLSSAAYDNLVSAVQANIDEVAEVEVHARGKEQRDIGAIDSAWRTILRSLVHLLLDADSGKSPSADELSLTSGLRSLVVSERQAGVISSVRIPNGVTA